MRRVIGFCALALGPACFFALALLVIFAWVGEGYPWGFIGVSVGLALCAGIGVAVSDAYDPRI